ncbi:DUF4157 domain-containing protein [Streptomyces sp. NPDC057702]|uniref:eCIS core domain-containing protein n=1 Tax=unclassified Streptomyces TaxID=2593676 RepID=UPI0036A1F771
MEARLGADFSDVRLHTDAAARASAAEVGARAYTSGNHVVIGDGGADRHTLAHELTHVIQQRQGPVVGIDNGSGLRISDPSDRFEREAEANATRVMATTPELREPVQRAGAPAGPGTDVAVQRVTRIYTADEADRDRANDLAFQQEVIKSVTHSREGISPRVKARHDSYNDGSKQGVYNHHVPHSAIAGALTTGLQFKPRNVVVDRLNAVSKSLGSVDPVLPNEFVSDQALWRSRMSFDTWVDEKIVNIADWPANLFRGPSMGDGGGSKLDVPTAPDPHQKSRLEKARGALKAAGLSPF